MIRPASVVVAVGPPPEETAPEETAGDAAPADAAPEEAPETETDAPAEAAGSPVEPKD